MIILISGKLHNRNRCRNGPKHSCEQKYPIHASGFNDLFLQRNWISFIYKEYICICNIYSNGNKKLNKSSKIPRTAVLASNTQHLGVVMCICSEKIYVSSFSTSHICRNVQLVVMYINMLLLLPPPNLLILTTLNCHYHTARKGVHKQNNI